MNGFSEFALGWFVGFWLIISGLLVVINVARKNNVRYEHDPMVARAMCGLLIFWLLFLTIILVIVKGIILQGTRS